MYNYDHNYLTYIEINQFIWNQKMFEEFNILFRFVDFCVLCFTILIVSRRDFLYSINF